MIYSKKICSNIPINIEKQSTNIDYIGTVTKYTVKEQNNEIGTVTLSDTFVGVEVEYIENLHPEQYSGFGKIADQIEVEHCLKRGLKYFDITSYGGLNSHALHYLRGKRFYSDEINNKVKEIIEKTPKGKIFNTKFLGKQRMYMPLEIIEKYKEIIKKHPLLKF